MSRNEILDLNHQHKDEEILYRDECRDECTNLCL